MLGARSLKAKIATTLILAAFAPSLVGCSPTGGASVGPPIVRNESIDGSASDNAPEIAQQRRDAVLRDVQDVLNVGGHLTITIFAQSAPAGVALIDQDIPTTDQLSGVQRADFVNRAQAAIKRTLGQALGLAPLTDHRLAAALKFAPANGSDIAGAVKSASDQTAEQATKFGRDARREIAIYTDGLQNDERVDLANEIGHKPVGQLVTEMRQLVPDASGAHIAMWGIGRDNDSASITTDRTLALVAVWKDFCEKSRAASCRIEATT
jgi:hypothetical protein